jgi:RecB family endonuclease NucS
MASLAKGELKNIFGDYREFLNLVPTTFNKVMDVFLTHVTSIDSIDVTYKYTCIELKIDRATESDLSQILRYEDWLARKLADGDNEMVQSILVASRFTDSVIDYIQKRKLIEEKTVNLMSYRVTENDKSIELKTLES